MCLKYPDFLGGVGIGEAQDIQKEMQTDFNLMEVYRIDSFQDRLSTLSSPIGNSC
jgi:hypothetical protein